MADYGKCDGWVELSRTEDGVVHSRRCCESEATHEDEFEHEGRLLRYCGVHRGQAWRARLLTPEYIAQKARRAEMRAVLDALGKAWERSPELSLEHMLRDVTNYPCTLGDNDARLLARLEKWRSSYRFGGVRR